MKLKILALAGVILLAAFIYQFRTENAVRNQGGIPMPDVSESAIQRADRKARERGQREIARVQAEAKAVQAQVAADLRVNQFSNQLMQAVSAPARP